MRFKVLKRFVNRWLLSRNFGSSAKAGAQWVARFLSPYLTANQVTLIGLFACLPMTLLFLNDEYVAAALFLTFSLLTDFADGALAHYQQGTQTERSLVAEQQLTLAQRINERGVTHLGKALDPFVDKVRFFCVLYALGFGMVASWLVVSLTVVAVVLTLIRPIKERYGWGDSRANRFGKFKIWAEIVGMILLVCYPTNLTLLNFIFSVALALGLSSLAGHLIAGYVKLRTRRRTKKLKRSSRRLKVVGEE